MSIFSPYEKRRVFLDLLNGNKVSILLDGTHADAKLPPHLVSNEEVCLTISYSYKLPVLNAAPEGIEVELSFRGSGFLCFLPWDAIYVIQAEGIPDDNHFTDLGSMPLRLRKKAVEAIGMTLDEVEELKWDAFEELEDSDHDSSDDGCIDFAAFLEKKKAEEHS